MTGAGMNLNKGTPLLDVQGLVKRFIGVIAVDQVDLHVDQGELVSLIGPNGSGKTTFFNCVTGFLTPEEGRVLYRDEDITSMRPDRIALRGICRTFQNVRIFPGLTVLENLILSIQQHQEDSILRRVLRTARIRHLDGVANERAEGLMERVGLIHMRDEPAADLVYGQRKLLEFACALIPDPQLIMLDEPAAGVSTALVDRMKEHIMELHGEGKAILLVEHNMGVVMDISQRIVVLDHGKKIAEGRPREIQDNELVREAYFGS